VSEGPDSRMSRSSMMSMLMQQQQEQLKTMSAQLVVMQEMCVGNAELMRKLMDEPARTSSG
jgi:hypothetical protein